MTCPKPTCNSQQLLKVTGANSYMCPCCRSEYLKDTAGNPYLKEPLVKKKSKYNNKREYVDGVYFDSQGEARYYSELKLRRQAHDIKWFALQPRFILQDGNRKVEYRADFIVCENDGTARVVDFKGFETDEFKMKRKLLETQYDLELEIVK